MERYDDEGHINVGTGTDVSIAELAEIVRSIVHPGSEIIFDRSKPDGRPRKLLDVSKIKALGWTAKIPLRQGIESAYAWYRDNADTARGTHDGGRLTSH